ncbi:MAG: prepilin peptidase [Chloroflexi bacterium]|nr:prepilin peptidase [Chloroflexota bacterium]
MATGLLVLFWAVLGTAVGSFLNVVADRLPQGGSFLSPPSHCKACGRRLAPVEMVPVFSYLALRGRCRTCGAPIGMRTLVVELGTGLLFALAAWRAVPAALGEWAMLLLTIAYLVVLVVVTVTDLEHGLILNRVIVPAIGLGLVGTVLTGWPGLLSYLGGGLLGAGAIALIITLVPGGMGWGDVRLAGFIGLVTGLPGVLFALFIGFVSGGIVAGALLASGRRRPGDTVPLGPFLALGGGAVLLYGEEMLRSFHALSALLG